MNRLITITLPTLSVAFFSLSTMAQNGFDNPDVISLLESNPQNHGLSAVTVIDAVNLEIGEGEMIAFIITKEGEFFFLDDDSQLFAAVVIKPVGMGKPEVLIFSSDIAALKKRTSGIAFFTDDISADDARRNNFEFIPAEHPTQTLEEFADEYRALHPVPKRKKAKSGAKANRNIAIMNNGFSH
jgi:hypothetical protein